MIGPKNTFPTDWTIDTTPQATPTWAPAVLVGAWGYDRDLAEEAAQDAACLGIAFQGCERPEELAGCGVAVLLLDYLHPWGNAESIYEDARKATANTGAVLVGVSYNEEHALAGRLPLYRSVLDVLTAVANGLLP